MTATMELQELAPSVLFPAKGPAGWDPVAFEDAMHQLGLRGPLAPPKGEERAGKRVRDLAGKLFIDSVADGLTPSEAVDVIIENEDYRSARDEYIGWCSKSPPRGQMVARKLFHQKLFAMSVSLGRTLEAGVRMENAMRSTLERLQNIPGADSIPSSVTDEERKKNPVWFLNDPVLPDVIVRGMLGSHRAYASSAALDGLLHRPSWNAPQISAAAKLWATEARIYLTLLASLPKAAVSTKLIPLDERVDLSRAIDEQRKLLAAMRASAA